MSKPTILLVPGSFAPPTIYQTLITLLSKRGYPAVALQLPSTQKRMPLPPATMEEDAETVKRAAETLISQGKDVVVLCHSYGGAPTTQGLANVAVKRIIYLTAVAPRVGQSQIEAMEMEEGFLPAEVGGYMHMDALAFAGAVVNDLPWEEAYPLTLQMPHHSRVSFDGKVSKVAYTKVPVTYIVTEKDLIISPEKQRAFIKTVEEAGGKVRVESLQSGHCPNWSVPEELAEVIVRNVEVE